jgi:hypothetical protein
MKTWFQAFALSNGSSCGATARSLEALVQLVRNCRDLADRADEALVAAGKKASKLHDTGALLMLVYRNTTNTSVK